MRVKSTAGEFLDLGDRLGDGGEALGVFRVINDATFCAKIYKDNQKAARLEKKIEAMIDIYKAVRQRKGEAEQFFDRYLAWPRLKLYDPQTGEFVGFVMNTLPLFAGLDGFFEEDMRGEKSWANRLEIAGNLLRVLKFLHGNGIIVGDLHKGNIFVLPNNEVALVDCDSFQIGNKFPCSALQPEIAPPESKYVQFFEPVADVFSAATLIYRLLMDGFNPFQFIRNGSLNPDLEQSKASGFAPIRDPKLELPPKSPSLERMPGVSRNVIAAALDPDPQKRPSIDALIGAVEEVKKNGKTPLPDSRQIKHVSSTASVISFPRTPMLTINSTTFDFFKIRRGTSVSGSFTISNVGRGLLIGSITTNSAWLKVCRNDIDVTRSKQDIEFTVDTSGLPVGFKDTGTIKVQSNGGTEMVAVNLSLRTTSFAFPVIVGIIVLAGSCAVYIQYKKVTSVPLVIKQGALENAGETYEETQREGGGETTLTPDEKEILPEEKEVEKAEAPSQNLMKLSEKLRKGAYLSWQKPGGYRGKTDKRSVVATARIERVGNVLRVQYGKGYAGTIDCTWIPDPGAYIGTWRDKGGSGKIQLTPLLDDDGAIICFVGYQRDGDDAPKMPTRITSYRPSFQDN